MTRNSPEILPYCEYCGEFKGVGPCKNPNCDKTTKSQTDQKTRQKTICAICSQTGRYSCSRCGKSYCENHATYRNEVNLVDIDQHIGTCSVCSNFVCEQCWILNEKGLILCITHLVSKKNTE